MAGELDRERGRVDRRVRRRRGVEQTQDRNIDRPIGHSVELRHGVAGMRELGFGAAGGGDAGRDQGQNHCRPQHRNESEAALSRRNARRAYLMRPSRTRKAQIEARARVDEMEPVGSDLVQGPTFDRLSFLGKNCRTARIWSEQRHPDAPAEDNADQCVIMDRDQLRRSCRGRWGLGGDIRHPRWVEQRTLGDYRIDRNRRRLATGFRGEGGRRCRSRPRNRHHGRQYQLRCGGGPRREQQKTAPSQRRARQGYDAGQDHDPGPAE